MKKMNKKGFTLIELLAVIVILGLLMAIAIPSVTKYINQSRKKTLAGTIANYIQAVSLDVNNGEYSGIIKDTQTYAIPIDCISLEKGGSNPFGEWFVEKKDEANNWVRTGYYAYVLVQYDGSNSYNYSFAFKDSGEHGLNATPANEIDGNAILDSAPAGGYTLVADEILEPGDSIGMDVSGSFTCKRAR